MSLREQQRSDYRHFQAIPTRWMDNDVYGHVNNVHYYSFFDTAVNQFLIERGVLDIHRGDVVGFVVETACSYFSPIEHVGSSSVRYGVGLFRNDASRLAAAGCFTHVYVNRASGKSVPVPDGVREVLEELRWTEPGQR